MKNLILFFVIILTVVSCKSNTILHCPDGEPIILTTKKNLILINETRSRLYNLSTELIAKSEGSIDAKTEILNIIGELDAYNSSYYLTLLAEDELLRQFPCDKKQRESYRKATSDARKYLFDIRTKLIEKGEALVKSSGLGGSSYEQFIYIANQFIKSS